MRSYLLILPALLFTFSACKRACYQCRQYCVYCEADNNPSVAYKICATKSSSYLQVDSFYNSFPDSSFNCQKLIDEQTVCGTDNSIDDAAAYYQKQNYFCYPQE